MILLQLWLIITLVPSAPTFSFQERSKNSENFIFRLSASRDNNELRTTVYRKPTHADRLLDQSSYNPTSHKATTIKTLTRRVQLVCDIPDSLSDENKYLDPVFYKNNYNADFIGGNIHLTTTGPDISYYSDYTLYQGHF